MKTAIIGGGISGVSAARMLKEKGHEVVLFEKESKPGGLVRCDVINGHLFHRTGGHVFNAKDKVVQDWFWSHFDKAEEFISAKRNAKIWLNGKLIGYPIENYLFQLDKKIVEKVLSDLLALNANGYRDPLSYSNFSEFLRGNFGDTLFQIYFQPYNEKIWHTDLTKVPLQWLEGKLPMPDYKQLLLNNLLREEESSMVHSSFYYPRQGGSQFIIDRLAQGVSMVCNSGITRAEFADGLWILNDSEKFDQVIFTGDVRQLKNMMPGATDRLAEALASVTQLKSNGTSNMLCETDETDISWLYLPDKKTKAHRIIYTGNFSPSNNAPTGRRNCVVEFSGLVSEQSMIEEANHLPGNLKPVAFNYEPNSYVIQQKDTRAKIRHLKSHLEPLQFFLSGRFAEWEYYNMDKAILSVAQLTAN